MGIFFEGVPKAMKCPTCGSENPDASSFCSYCGSSMSKRIKSQTEEIEKSLFDLVGISLSPGDSFGERYTILEEIDRGGMGQIYKAEDKILKIVVALKIIHPQHLSRTDAINRFKKEILLAREISHENVIRIHDFGEEKGIKFISMQYVDGETLKDLIDRTGKLDVKTTLNISRQICEGLKAAHKKGIVHRDLKPHNIMIDKQGTVFIMDFGLAKSIEGEGISFPEMVVGTPEYLSPEQAKGEKVDARSDLYSLGIIMYEMVTGELPFNSETVLGYITKHINTKPASPSSINPLLPSFLNRIILKCLEKKSNNRYQNVQEILRDFSLEEVETGPFFLRPRVQKIMRRLSGLFLIFMIALAVFLITKLPKTRSVDIFKKEIKSVAVMYFENQTGDHSLDQWSIALADLMTTDLAQSRYFRVLPENRLFQILKNLGQERGNPILPAMVKQIASKGRVDHVITGSFIRAGDIFRVNIQILNPISGEFIDSGHAEGKGVESFFAIIDQLTRKVKTRFHIPWQAQLTDIDREISKITTSSTEALQNYITGKHLINLMRYEESIRYFENAIKLDPKFGMAFWGMGLAYAYLGDWENRRISFGKTMTLLDFISDRERYLIEGMFYGESDSTFQKSLDAFENLLKLYPDDCEGNEQMGIANQFLERWDKAIECFEKNRKNQCLTLHGSVFLAYSYMGKGLYDKALEVLDKAAELFSDNGLLRQFRSRIYLVQNKFDLALMEMKKAIKFEPSDYNYKIGLGNIYLFKQNYEKAEELFMNLINKKDIPQYAAVIQELSKLYFLLGKFKKSLEWIKKGIHLGLDTSYPDLAFKNNVFYSYISLKQNKFKKAIQTTNDTLLLQKQSGDVNQTHLRLILYLKALAQLETRQTEKAMTTIEKLKKSIDSCCHKNQIKFYYHLLGVKALKAEQFTKAREYLEKALSYQSNQVSFHFGRDMHALFYSDLAFVHLKLGHVNRSQQFYEKINNLSTGRYYFGNIYANSFYNLAKIFQKRGWNGKAIDNYEQFLKIRAKADPGIIEVMDAKKQLAILKEII